jgi:CRP-like cAMP-binding protein
LFSKDTKVEALRRVPLFEGLSGQELEQLATTSEDLDVPAGKILCRQGDVGHEFFVIVNGDVEVVKDGERITVLGPGDFFGEIALVEHVERSATVTALTPVRFFVLTRRGFWGLLDESPEVTRSVMAALGKRLRSTSDDPTL